MPTPMMNSDDGPVSPETYKRAVYKRAPKNFRVKLLPPEKQGSSYSYGFRIYPIKDDDNASTITRSASCDASIAPVDEYDVWRRWEDCLWFQETLETSYSLAAREKRNRLAAGKGVKKNGVYVHSDQAASWESLPFGPDPHDIASDVHQHIPRLSKKATIFRASQETIDQRYQDLQMMFQALFEDDLPTLIKEFKNSRTFTDFFGVWRRDIDLAQKAQALQKSSGRPRQSLSSSIMSAFPLSPASVAPKSSPTKGKAPERVQRFPATSFHSDSSSEDLPRHGRQLGRMQEIRSLRSRESSSGSHSSSSTPSTPVTMPRQLPPTSRQPVIASQEVPIRFGHSPHVLISEHSSFVLESLPEDRELSSSPKSDPDFVRTRRRSESASKNRNTRIYVPAPACVLDNSELSSRSLSRYSRASLQSTRSSATLRAAAYLDELDVDYCLPSPTPEPKRRFPRASVSSLASVVTNSSVDAVIPRDERPSRLSANNPPQPHLLPEYLLTEYEPLSEDDYLCEEQGDLLDAYFYDMIPPEPEMPIGYPETPTVAESMYHFTQEQSNTTISTYSGFSGSERRSSWTTSISSGSTSSSGNPMMLTIKATHEDNIVILRIPRHISYDELRQRVYDKFTQNDKATICATFAIALVEQRTVDKVGSGRPRAGSVSSLGSTHTQGAALHFINSQEKWADIAATHYGKIFLRIIGSRE